MQGISSRLVARAEQGQTGAMLELAWCLMTTANSLNELRQAYLWFSLADRLGDSNAQPYLSTFSSKDKQRWAGALERFLQQHQLLEVVA